MVGEKEVRVGEKFWRATFGVDRFPNRENEKADFNRGDGVDGEC